MHRYEKVHNKILSVPYTSVILLQRAHHRDDDKGELIKAGPAAAEGEAEE